MCWPLAHYFFGDQLPRYRNLCKIIGQLRNTCHHRVWNPELCCGTGSCRSQENCISSLKEGLKCWVYHLYRGENSDQPSKFSFERNTSEGGGTQNRRQRFLFVCAEYTCIFTLFEQQKKKKGKKKKITFSPCHWSFHLLFVILTLKKTFSTWAFTLTG